MSAWSSLLYATLAECVDRSDCFCLPVSLCPSVCVFPCLRYLCVCLSMSVYVCVSMLLSVQLSLRRICMRCTIMCVCLSAVLCLYIFIRVTICQFVCVCVCVRHVCIRTQALARRHKDTDTQRDTHPQRAWHRLHTAVNQPPPRVQQVARFSRIRCRTSVARTYITIIIGPKTRRRLAFRSQHSLLG